MSTTTWTGILMTMRAIDEMSFAISSRSADGKISILRGMTCPDQELIARAKAGLGDESMADLNTATLDGEAASRTSWPAIMAIPFLTERRLVILERAGIPQPPKEEERPKVLALLEEMPESTLLLFIIEDEPCVGAASAAETCASTAGCWIG